MPPAGAEHGSIGMEWGRRIANHVVDHNLGETYSDDTGFTIVSDPDIVLAPDIAFIRTKRLPPKEERVKYLAVPPDLAVEVVSPSDWPTEVAEKVALYLAAGVPVVWVLWPRPKTIAVHRPGREPLLLGVEDVLDRGDVLPGFRLHVAELFR